MVDFPSTAPTPSAPLTGDSSFRLLEAGFGDGYSQRTPDGLNTEKEVYPLVWDIITEAEKDILVDFFRAREGAEAFNYTMPWDSTSKKWIVRSFKPTKITASYYKVEASFERVYDI